MTTRIAKRWVPRLAENSPNSRKLFTQQNKSSKTAQHPVQRTYVCHIFCRRIPTSICTLRWRGGSPPCSHNRNPSGNHPHTYRADMLQRKIIHIWYSANKKDVTQRNETPCWEINNKAIVDLFYVQYKTAWLQQKRHPRSKKDAKTFPSFSLFFIFIYLFCCFLVFFFFFFFVNNVIILQKHSHSEQKVPMKPGSQ